MCRSLSSISEREVTRNDQNTQINHDGRVLTLVIFIMLLFNLMSDDRCQLLCRSIQFRTTDRDESRCAGIDVIRLCFAVRSNPVQHSVLIEITRIVECQTTG